MADKLEAGRALVDAARKHAERGFCGPADLAGDLFNALAAYDAAQEHDCESRIDREQCDRMTEQAATLATDNARLRAARTDVQAEREAYREFFMQLAGLMDACGRHRLHMDGIFKKWDRIRRGDFAPAQKEGEDG